MSDQPWWEGIPGRLEHELEALDKAGIKYGKDKTAFAAGVLKLDLRVPYEGRDVKLCAVFPDFYPYFPFELYAPDLSLNHHQHPFGKNLCLFGRSTERWYSDETLASVLLEQFPQVVRTGQSTNPEEVEELEQHQAEPFTDYYSYHPGNAIIVDGGWFIDTHYKWGTLSLGVASGSAEMLSAAVLEVRDEKGQTLAQADKRLRAAFDDGNMLVRWVRLPEAPKTDNKKDLFILLTQVDPYPYTIDTHALDAGRLQVRAAVFPEEVRNWRQLDQGWLFVCRLEPQKSWEEHRKNKRGQNKNKKRKRGRSAGT